MKPARARLPGAIVALGLTSLLTDVSSEMIVPLLPALLVSMSASAAMLGLVEGVATAVASLLQLASGWVADRVSARKPLVLAGYLLSGLARPLMAIAATPMHVLGIRVVDRIGKGVRSAPRDAIISLAAVPGEEGRAFGFHQGMDHAGAVLGPIVATALLAAGVALRDVFWVAAIPGALAVICVIVLREPSVPARAHPAAKTDERPIPAGIPRALVSYLGVLAFFALGNSSDTFLLLRARDLGVPLAVLPMLWSVLHVSKVASTWLFGAMSDRVPRARLVAIGWLVYAVCYVALGAATEQWQAWAIFVVYGTYHGLTEPVEKAMVKSLAPAAAQGRAFGLYNMVIGLTAIPAGLITGWLWDAFGPFVALSTGAAVALVASGMLAIWQRGQPVVMKAAQP
jgi:MFS family permease